MTSNINFNSVPRSLTPFEPDTLPKVFSYLNIEDVFACSLVCKLFHTVTSNEDFCKMIYEGNFQAHYPMPTNVSFFTACKAYHRVRLNVLNGIFCNHHRPVDSSIETLIIFDEMICIGMYNRNIKVLNLKTGDCLRTLQGHHDIVNSLTCSDGKVYSGSSDNTIKIWNPKTGACLNTLIGHDSYVICLGIHQKKLYSGSYKTVMVWDLETEKHLKTLNHKDTVRSITFSSGELIVGLDDGKIKIWNLETYTSKTFPAHLSAVTCLRFSHGKLFSGSDEGTIKIWDLENHKGLVLRGHTKAVDSLALFGKILFSASEDKTIKIWNSETGKMLNTLSGHQGMVNCLSISHGKLYSGSADKTLIAWDFTANHSRVFRQLADLLEEGDETSIEEAATRFLSMPEEAKNKVYEKLGNVAPEDATPQQIAQAIEASIAKN